MIAEMPARETGTGSQAGEAGTVDIVYTWVDDTFPGYRDLLARHAGTSHDTNPNRTRDNLDLLRYSLRSLDAHVPFARKVYLLSCRPQVPAWLDADHPDLVVVHHDEIMAPDILPTFNSFAIVSHLAKLPGLSSRFVYFEDDMLAFSPLGLGDFLNRDGRMRAFLTRKPSPVLSELDPARASPWNLAMGTANEELVRRLGGGRRTYLAHGPQLIDKALFEEMCEVFAEAIDTTRRSRFRAGSNVPPEYLYPHFAVATGHAVAAEPADLRRTMGYASLENWLVWTWAQLRRLEWAKPLAVTLNDSFGSTPNPRVVAHMRAVLESWFPVPSRFEKPRG